MVAGAGVSITRAKTLDEMLDVWSVHDPGRYEGGECPKGWYPVSNNDGIVAYFAKEEDAFRFRLAEINRELNG